MRRALLQLAAALVAGLGAFTPAARAEWPRLPPIEGELTGKFSTSELPGAPPLEWKLTVKAVGPGRRSAEIAFGAEGLKVVARVEIEAVTGDGTWQLTEGQIDLAPWWPVIAGKLGGAMDGLTAGGRLVLHGAGELKAGRPAGKIVLGWSDGAVRQAVQGWALEGMVLAGEFEFDATTAEMRVASAGPLTLGVRTISTSRFGARNLTVTGKLNERREFAVAAARVEIAGGDVGIDPCLLPLAPPVVDVTVHIQRVGLQDVAAFAPAGLADARGRISGTVRLGWSEAKGLQVGAGDLALCEDEPAMVRLAESPGFLTNRVPERVALVPAWLGPVARWLSPVNPAYAELSELELGRAELQVRALKVRLTPEGDDRGRSAYIQISALPAKPGSVMGPVSFEINVAGPLADVLRMSMNQPVSVQVR